MSELASPDAKVIDLQPGDLAVRPAANDRRTPAPAWPPTLTATQDGRHGRLPASRPGRLLPLPQGDKPCPVTYQPGAWLAQLPAKPTAAVQDRPHRADEIDASIQQALRKLYEAVAGDAVAGDPDDLAGLPADMERSSVAVGELVGAGTTQRAAAGQTSSCGDDHAVLTILEARGQVPVGDGQVSSREERVARNESTTREINEGIEQAHQAASTPDHVRIVCECGRLECDRVLAITIAEYESVRADPRQFAVARDHVMADVERVVAETDRYAVVAKRQGIPAAVAIEEDPRG